MPEKEHLSREQEVERAAKIREKKERGETLTREEAGFLGAVASRQSTAREAREAKESGREKQFEERHRTRSWMAGEATRAPHLSEEDRAREHRLREKQDRGETLSREEAGFLGGVARAREAGE